jgi:DNA polymerase-3 subunit epsilon
MLERLSLRIRIFLFFALLAVAGVLALAMGLTLGYRRLGTPETLNAFVQGGVIAAFVILGVVAWVWFLFDTHVAKAIERLAGTIRSRSHAQVTGELDRETARYLGDLAPAVGAALASLSETRNALAESVARETTRLAGEKARLEALLSDVPVGVLLCSPSHQLVFYNGLALDLLGTQGGVAGLDRRLFDYLREGPVRHAYQRLLETDDPEAASDILCATRGTPPQLLAARMRLLHAGGQDAPGYVITLRDVTADLAAHSRREQLLAEVFDRVRRPAANLQTVMGVLAEDQGADRAGALDRAMRAEVGLLTRAITELGARYDEGRSDWWPLAMTRGSDLLDSARARFEAAGLRAEGQAADLLLRCNGFEIIALLGDLARRVAARDGVRAFRLDVAEDGPGAMLVLGWQGAPLPVGVLDGWLAEPLEVGVADVTGRSVLHTHATECWPEHDGAGARLMLPIRQARRAGRRPRPVARAVVYDFDLLSQARAEKVADMALDRLTCVVFDTETTGLLPERGDEIVQIAAVRLVNGRRVEGEVFDTLVNPGRPIPPGSTEVHGITDAMVAEAAPVAEVIPQFHRFAEGAVLVAHNAPFDMTFLRRREGELGLRFDHPILDTVLLSAVVWGQSEVHSLDALTHRLGITIPEEARHTAIGDTVATAEAFLKLVPMLQARGLRTFGEVLAEVRRHGRLLKDANERKAG